MQALYTLIVISTKVELYQQFSVNKDRVSVFLIVISNVFQFTYVVLVNCGANFDILKMLEAPAHSIFFVCDR